MTHIFLSKKELKIGADDLRLTVVNYWNFVGCKMFSRKLLMLKRLQESLPTAWELITRDLRIGIGSLGGWTPGLC